jgi:hypothetical protein
MVDPIQPEYLLMNGRERWPIVTDKTARPLRLALLICLHIVIGCVSLVYIAGYELSIFFITAPFHIFFDPTRWYVAVVVVAAFALVSSLFIFAKFSFGYFAGFYLYTMILGYLWLNCFSDLSYDHRSAGLSAAASAVAFLLPALFFSSPVRRMYALTATSFDRLLTGILILGLVTVGIGAIYNFQIVTLAEMYAYRAKLDAPLVVNYLITMVSSALLPFAFAGLVASKAYWRAATVLVVLALFYPILLNKTVLFAPLWLIAMLVVSQLFEARFAVIVSLLAPMLVGLVLLILLREHGALYFYTVNLRMLAVPSVAMDVYNDFFSRHDLTYYCQISALKRIMDCPYQSQLGVIMEPVYKLGNFNASLFATEGVGSVGILFAPVAAFLCGLVIALGNRLSAGLPAGFILVSGALIPQFLLNVPLTTVLLTHGAGLLFLLWYITPRGIFGSMMIAEK